MVSEDHPDLVSNTHVPSIRRELLPVNNSDVEPGHQKRWFEKDLEHSEEDGKGKSVK